MSNELLGQAINNIIKKRVVACDNKKFKKITLYIFDEVKTLKIATTEKIDTIYF